MQMLVEVDRLDGTIGTAQMQLNPLKLTGNDAAADVILKLVTSNQRDFVDANGILTQNTNDEVLSFLVNYGDHTATDPNDNRLTPEQRRRRLDKQFYKDENGNVLVDGENVKNADRSLRTILKITFISLQMNRDCRTILQDVIQVVLLVVNKKVQVVFPMH